MSNASGTLRFYPELRSAHIERAWSMGGTYLYFKKREDFHDELLASANAQFHQVDLIGLLYQIAKNRPSTIEVPEPLWLRYLGSTALIICFLRVRKLAGLPKTIVVSYAIENADSVQLISPLPSIGRRPCIVLLGLVFSFVCRHIDWICFGTDGARTAFFDFAGPRLAQNLSARCSVVQALPSRCSCLIEEAEANAFLFLGEFHPRKGFDLLLEAWASVRVEDAQAMLQLVGYGPMLAEASALAAVDPRVALRVRPSRREIHQILCTKPVLVLPSQPTRRWREQVGLPIVEGLAHGCTIVTTTETGISNWLREAGHEVLSNPWTAPRLAASMTTALRNRASYELPRLDGRLEADLELMQRAALIG